jgi:hypothetical protein
MKPRTCDAPPPETTVACRTSRRGAYCEPAMNRSPATGEKIVTILTAGKNNRARTFSGETSPS